MRTYADTSFLGSLYVLDENSLRAAAEIKRFNPVLIFTPLLDFELTNAIQLRVFRKLSSPREAAKSLRLIHQQTEAGLLAREPMPAGAYERARRISLERTARLGVSTIDVLHVASALALKAELFLTFDHRQHRLARAEGLKTTS